MFKAKCLLVLALSVPLFYEVYREGKSLANPSKLVAAPTFATGITAADSAVKALAVAEATTPPFTNLGKEAFPAALRVSDDPKAVNVATLPVDVTVKDYGKALREARDFVTVYGSLDPDKPIPDTILNKKYREILAAKQDNVKAEQEIRAALREEPWKESAAARKKLDGLVAKYKERSNFNSSFVDAVDAVLKQDKLEKRLIELKNQVLNSGFNVPPAGSGGAAAPPGGLEGEVENVINELKEYAANYQNLGDPRNNSVKMGKWAGDQLAEWEQYGRYVKLPGGGGAPLTAVLPQYEALYSDALTKGNKALADKVRQKAVFICKQYLPGTILCDQFVFVYDANLIQEKVLRQDLTIHYKMNQGAGNQQKLRADDPAEKKVDKKSIDYLKHADNRKFPNTGDVVYLINPTTRTEASWAYNGAREELSASADRSRTGAWSQGDISLFEASCAQVKPAKEELAVEWAKIQDFVTAASQCRRLFP